MNAKVFIVTWMLFCIPVSYAEDIEDISLVQKDELPKTTETKKTLNLQIDSGKVNITLPKGRSLEVIDLKDNQVVALFSGQSVLVPVDDTTIKTQIIAERQRLAEIRRKQDEAQKLEEERVKEENTARIASEEAKKRDILVKSWSWSLSSESYYRAVGEIQNESNYIIKHLDVEVILRDDGGNVVCTGSAMANDSTLSPGDTTTFNVLIRKSGDAKTASLAFRSLGYNGSKYSYRIKED
jgi:hypothetical protein